MLEQHYLAHWECALRDLQHKDNHVVAIAGDAAFTVE